MGDDSKMLLVVPDLAVEPILPTMGANGEVPLLECAQLLDEIEQAEVRFADRLARRHGQRAYSTIRVSRELEALCRRGAAQLRRTVRG